MTTFKPKQEEVESGNYRSYRIVKVKRYDGSVKFKSEYLIYEEWLPNSRLFSNRADCVYDLKLSVKRYLEEKVIGFEYEDYSIDLHVKDFNNEKEFV